MAERFVEICAAPLTFGDAMQLALAAIQLVDVVTAVTPAAAGSLDAAGRVRLQLVQVRPQLAELLTGVLLEDLRQGAGRLGQNVCNLALVAWRAADEHPNPTVQAAREQLALASKIVALRHSPIAIATVPVVITQKQPVPLLVTARPRMGGVRLAAFLGLSALILGGAAVGTYYLTRPSHVAL